MESPETDMNIANVTLIGGGTMGNGIAQVFAMSGRNVTLVETGKQLAERALATIEKSLDRMQAKDRITAEQKEEALARISWVLSVEEGVQHADLVVEAVPENFGLKKKILEQADAHAPDHAILATNTSSLSITRLASVTSRPEQFIGMHFFNPVPVMKLVEVIRGHLTSDSVRDTITLLTESLDKVPVHVNDSPGFVSNRVLMPLINEAVFCVGEGIATPEAVDQVMKLGMAHPMGPLRLADFIGLDVCLDILNVLYDGFKDPKYRPAPLLVKMVDAGKLGNKTGEGFFKYND